MRVMSRGVLCTAIKINQAGYVVNKCHLAIVEAAGVSNNMHQ
jgi:hypothetical protein